MAMAIYMIHDPRPTRPSYRPPFHVGPDAGAAGVIFQRQMAQGTVSLGGDLRKRKRPGHAKKKPVKIWRYLQCGATKIAKLIHNYNKYSLWEL